MQPNILEIHIEEPTSDPAQPSIHHALADDLGEAERRYRALIRVLISQLTGLNQTLVKFIISPADEAAVEAVSFWMLSLFRGKVIKHGEHFQFTPEQHAPGFSIVFTTHPNLTSTHHEKSAILSAHCPSCSSRWINTAMTQCNESNHVVGEGYLTINHRDHLSKRSTISLPDLPVILTDSDWQQALDSPIGPKLAIFHDEICRNS